MDRVDGICERCKQSRVLFEYEPLHDCIRDIGLVSLDEAVEHIDWIRDFDPWCELKLDRWPNKKVCTSCYQSETVEEQAFIDENDLE